MFPLLMVVVCADRASSLDILDSVLCAAKPAFAAVINSRVSVLAQPTITPHG
jgi:hypothetical protein